VIVGSAALYDVVDLLGLELQAFADVL
jgi:hypothetical protein